MAMLSRSVRAFRLANPTIILQGSHGGSGLSGVGGTIRVGELLPSAPPIPHALKIELQHQWYFGGHKLANDSAYNGGRSQYVWPAVGSDGGSNKAPGGLYTGTDPHVAPGALLAIPASAASGVKTTTVAGGKIKRALVEYGGYIVDDTGGGNSAAICMEADVNAEMRSAFGYAMTYPHGVSAAASDPVRRPPCMPLSSMLLRVAAGSHPRGAQGHALYADLLAIFQALHAVTNNGPGSVGGGGTPAVPTKPPICGAGTQ